MYKKILAAVAAIFVLLICGIAFQADKHKKQINELKEQLEYYKNIDNSIKTKIDSIEYNIIYKDSVITEIKKNYIDEIEIVKNNNDVDALVEFERLVRAE